MFMRNEISLSSYLKNAFKHKIVSAQKKRESQYYYCWRGDRSGKKDFKL